MRQRGIRLNWRRRKCKPPVADLILIKSLTIELYAEPPSVNPRCEARARRLTGGHGVADPGGRPGEPVASQVESRYAKARVPRPHGQDSPFAVSMRDQGPILP
jgi:hypothetical protein